MGSSEVGLEFQKLDKGYLMDRYQGDINPLIDLSPRERISAFPQMSKLFINAGCTQVLSSPSLQTNWITANLGAYKLTWEVTVSYCNIDY